MKKTGRKTLQNKIKSSRGETIAESLVSMLILALAMVMLAGGIVTAAKINMQIEEKKTAFSTSDAESREGKVKIDYDSAGADAETIPVIIHITQDENKYVYYEK